MSFGFRLMEAVYNIVYYPKRVNGAYSLPLRCCSGFKAKFLFSL